MRTAACLLLSLLALSAVADASKLGDALKERLDDMPKVTAADVAEALSQLHDSIQEQVKEAAAEFAKKRPNGVVANLVGGARRRLQTVGVPFQEFMSNFFGEGWSSMVPSGWSLPSFDWSKLGEFDYTNNLGDFMAENDLQSLTQISSVGDLNAAAESIESKFCTPEAFEPAAKVPASCTGPTVTISLVPKVCTLESATKQVVCDPAKLVLTKSPGSCTHKYLSASTWTGKVRHLTTD
ncbi:hypothetical protein D9Q98_009547 [Chlorella vulgaris]|uniref:Uncharacterized protein n=1 Tax=Chlorella vulgaris TaxID=3077 RepID=A0A9D4TFF4_CHLVU|nr:hypothetical protein D9Q98_009547 [Chlorella vulgaris]